MLRLKYIITTICLLFGLLSASHAQQQKEFQAIESEKVAYITKELKLTPAEAQKFFPIYNKYNDEMWEIKRAKRGADNSHRQRDVIAFDAKEVEIKKKYRAEFTKVIGTARASQFFQVVEDFYDILRNRLQKQNR